ncbi:reverse transcriptase domain-containing protein [Tanacetum coccineum]|uniref:Reverse transcriptase domain-containing protein n=1 Tax=Tanacetum coccineum TaxID=301880 RepID=A0ABQ5HFP3_9ASTR
MKGILRTIIVGGKPFNMEYRLNEFKHIEPIKQKKRGLALERNEVICKEVEELTKANILREVKYQTWVSNLVMVKKDDGRWKLYVDFTDINKYALKIATLYKKLIRKKIPFGLKNAGATYQRLVDKVFGNQIGWNLKVHIDEMVIKSDFKEGMLVDIQENFDKLRSINMKLNPRKCSFNVEKGPFLRHLITKKGIKANPSKAQIRPSPFFKVLKSCTNKKMVPWTSDAEETFQNIKEFIKTLPMLMTPIKGEALVMYLAASMESISSVLLAKIGKRQFPIYFISRTLEGADLDYLELEKLILALVNVARRLRRFFQAHPIRILTNKPIKQFLARPEKSGRIAKWAIELGEHDIEFRGCYFVKGQILADFLAKTPSAEDEEMEAKKATDEESESENLWKLYTDGALSFDGSEVGMMLVSHEGKEYT